MRTLLALTALLFLTACAGRPDLEDQADAPTLVLEEYFAGETRAWGQFQDIFGNISRRFIVEIEAHGTAKPSPLSRTSHTLQGTLSSASGR